ncbi:hypothetical protein [Streptomyces scopuliridis]|uniref:hypothetical protein n=1 Tax=Streptomyces scopuliridis TaxID=452529 RepID=UPI00342FFDE3
MALSLFTRRPAVQTAPQPVPPPPGPAPTVLCTGCGCTAIGWQICNDGCHGVTDQADGRCQACIDPRAITDWSKVREGEESECALCGAPFYSSRRYCSTGCELADDEGNDDEDEGDPGTRVSLTKPTLGYPDEPPF